MSPTSNQKRDFKAIVRMIALPAAMFGASFFLFLANNVCPPGRLRVIEKDQSGSRCYIFARSDPNKNGGRFGFRGTYPKWFYDKVKLGDWLMTGYGHFRLVRDGQLLAVCVPWDRLFPEGFVPLAWCMPLVLWLPRPKVLQSWFVVGSALVIELSLVGFFVYGLVLNLWWKFPHFWA